MPLGHSPRNPAVRVLRRSATVVLTSLHGLGKRSSGAGSGAASGADRAALPQNLARVLRERSRAGTHAWAATVALIQAFEHRRAALRHSGAGRVVIFDRYTLDSCAQLRFFYGAANEFRVQKWLIRVVSPKARCAYLLDVPAETLLMRKDLQYSPMEVQQQVGLYQSEAARLRVHRLDGERPMDELSEEIARDVWKRIG